MELVDDGYELGRDLTLLPLPGHTPGQLGVRVEGAVPAIFCGDAIHSPLQVLIPHCRPQGVSTQWKLGGFVVRSWRMPPKAVG